MNNSKRTFHSELLWKIKTYLIIKTQVVSDGIIDQFHSWLAMQLVNLVFYDVFCA